MCDGRIGPGESMSDDERERNDAINRICYPRLYKPIDHDSEADKFFIDLAKHQAWERLPRWKRAFVPEPPRPKNSTWGR
jgi:hypothetical protein